MKKLSKKSLNNMENFVGQYRNGPTWTFCLPDTEISGNVYAVAGVVFRGDNYLITKNKRGREIPAGHIEEGETQIEAVKREIMEEVGAKVKSAEMIGYLKYELMKVKMLPQRTIDIGTSVYLPIYVCEAEEIVYEPTGEEILDHKEKKILSIMEEDDLTPSDKELLKYAIKKRRG